MNWKAIGAGLLTGLGVVITAAHTILPLFPQYAGTVGPIVAAAGLLLQATTDAVHHAPGTVVPGTTPDGAVIPNGTTVAAVGAVAK